MCLPLYSMLLCMIPATCLSESPNVFNTFSNLADNVKNDYSIDRRLFAVEPKSTLIYHNNKNELPLKGGYFVENIGRSQVTVTDGLEQSGTTFRFKKKLMPGENVYINYSHKHHVRKYLRISNPHATRAIVYITGGSDLNGNPPEDYDKSKVLQKAFNLGVKKISGKESLNLARVLSYFWPNGETSVWGQLYQELETLLDDNIKSEITYFFILQLDAIECGIRNIIKSPNDASLQRRFFEYVYHKENNFITMNTVGDNSLDNFYILPFYTNFITMKLLLYQCDDRDLDIDIKNTNKKHFNQITIDAIKYVNEMYKNAIDAIYNTVYPGALYNEMMTARTHIALHGLEMIPIWQELGGIYDKEDYSRVTTYSNFYGTATPKLFQQATPPRLPFAYYPPLRSIDFHMCTDNTNQHSIICGIRLIFDNSFYFMGKTSEEIQKLKIEKWITKLTVYGGNIVKCLKFTLSDETIKIFGVECLIEPVVFELEDHHIDFLSLTNDNFETGSNFDNIAVTFIRNWEIY